MKRFRDAMTNAGIAPHLIELALLHFNKTTRRKRDPAPVWSALLHGASYTRLSVTSNRGKRKGHPMEPLYEMYAAIAQEALIYIEHASTLVNDDGQPVQPYDLEKRRAVSNAKRAAEGKPLLPECKHDTWYTWVAPARRQELLDAVARYYSDNGITKGKRFTPFVTTADRQAVANRVTDLANQIAQHRAMFKTPHSSNDSNAYGGTPYAALQVRACAQAAQALEAHRAGVKAGKIDPVVTPLPTHWTGLLEAELRTRMRKADDNPTVSVLTEYEERNFMDTREDA